jgi:phosphopantetheine--protein transferase-like protein
MILGVGVDIVDIARFTRALERTPKLGERLFTDAERELPATSLGGRFAAKEACQAFRQPVDDFSTWSWSRNWETII